MRRLGREANPLRKALAILGPGFITGASDDDPSGIGTYAQAGAQYGYATLWMTVAMLPMMSAVQYICAKIGMVSGRGLAGVLRQHYPRAVLYPAVLAMVLANTINAGADLGAIAGAINLLLPVPAIVWVVPITAAILLVQVLGSYRLIERVFKWLTLALLAYIGAALFARPRLLDVLAGTLIPTIHLDPQFIAILVALLGTTISPYLFFWQASHEVEAELDMGRHRLRQRQGASKAELRYALWDTLAGMTFSEVVAYFIILATGATLFVHGKTQIASATDAAQALRPIAGDASSALLAVGLIGAGVLAVPILTGAAAYGVSEAFAWPFGLDRKPTRAPQFYAVIVLATLVGMAINFLGVDPIAALVVTAIINGLLAPPLLVLVMLVANDRKVMGERTNGRWLNVLGWLTTGLMGLAAIALVATAILG
ncbi:MAG TPA: divalent metal cation transporter [Candidatus Dormibacteraeota bacterium]|nr:divalent metal cation transporter [Candidatus Dormibacteraeota bacterium]